MKRIIQSLLVASAFIPSAFSWADTTFTYEDPFALRVAKEGDLEMECHELINEAMLMRDIIQTTEDIQSKSDFNGHAVTAAGAVGSFLVGTATAGLGLAAAGFVASQEVEQEGEHASDVQGVAHQRRALMAGIYKTKGCDQDHEIFVEAMRPVKRKSSLAAGQEQLNTIEPASGKTVRTARVND